MISRFADTLQNGKALHLYPLPSPIPRGQLTGLRIPEEFRDLGVLRAEDIPGSSSIEAYGEKLPILAGPEIRYQGEALALLYGPDLHRLREAAQEIQIDYESDYSLDDFSHPRDDQLYGETNIDRGNSEKAFEEAEHIIEGSYQQQDPVPNPAAPLGVLVEPEESGYTVTAANLWPEQIRKSCAEAAGIAQKELKVLSANPFPSDGEQLILPVMLSCWALLCAQASGKAVQIAWDVPPRELPFLRSAISSISYQTAVDGKGNVSGERIRALVDLGAYPFLSDELLRRIAIGAAGSRYTSSLSISVQGVKTSKAPVRLRNGFGISRGLFARELHNSRIAGIMDEDPAERRMKHAGKGRLPTGGLLKEKRDLPLLEAVCRASDFKRKFSAYQLMRKRVPRPKKIGQYRGIGIASGFTGDGFTAKPPGRDPWSVEVHLDKHDALEIYLKAGDYPGSVQKIWKEQAGAILGIDAKAISIESRECDFLGIGPMIGGQRISIATSLIESCCNSIKRQRFKDPLPLRMKKTWRSPSTSVWDRSSLRGIPFQRRSWGAVVVELEIDPVSYLPFIRGVWCALDCGKIHKRRTAEAELRASILRVITHCTGGESLLRHRQRWMGLYEEEELLTLPDIFISFNEDSKESPSGLSQMAASLVPAAFISAISQATGLYLDSLPLSPEMLHSYLKEEPRSEL